MRNSFMARAIPAGVAIASFFAAVACSSALPRSSFHSKGPGYQLSGFMRKNTLMERRRDAPKPLSCSFKGGVLTYSNGRRSQGIRLDVKVDSARRTICSDLYTVILTPKSAVVSLGGEPILAGREMLGMLGDRFVPANSYSVDITRPASEGMEGASVVKTRLILRTGKSSWAIDLSNPSVWNIY